MITLVSYITVHHALAERRTNVACAEALSASLCSLSLSCTRCPAREMQRDTPPARDQDKLCQRDAHTRRNNRRDNEVHRIWEDYLTLISLSHT